MNHSALLLCVLASSATAQEKATFIIDVVGGPVSPHNPSVTVKIFASFPSQYWAFGIGTLDLLSSDPNGYFFNAVHPSGPGSLPSNCTQWVQGTSTAGGGVTMIGAQQFNVVGCNASTWNPIQIWESSWTTTDFTPRSVELQSADTPEFMVFRVYKNHQSSIPDVTLYPDQFIHGATSFQVVPAPWIPAFALAFGFTGLARRHR